MTDTGIAPNESSKPIDGKTDGAVGRSALAKASWRLLPLLGLGYLIAYMDRVNISFASLQMNKDLHFSATAYGLGGGLFFLSYAALEVPSNLMLVRFGARRWIARIMLTWGVIAACMMFVRTPMQFYAMRFLLGAAEAGFFPGVIFYLMQWFPASERGRAISRFYIALPLSSVVMGTVAGALLGLNGQLGLTGWQWLFLVEGLPAIVLSLFVLLFLPNGPEDAKWLTGEERAWIETSIAADRARIGEAGDPGIGPALMDPRLWLLGVANICILGAAYSFTLSTPKFLMGATHLDATKTGFLIAAVAVVAAAGMVMAGWHSDRQQERFRHVLAYLMLIGISSFVLGISNSAWVIVAAYTVWALATTANQTVFWSIPGDVLHGRSAAVVVAAIGSIGMVGAFGGPYLWGKALDRTGSYQPGLLALAAAYFVSAAMVWLVWRRSRTTNNQLEVAATEAIVAE